VRYRPQTGEEELVQEGVTRKAGKGDAVNVEKQGEAALHFADGLDVRIFHDSRLTLTSEVNPNAAPIYRYRLEAGTTFNTVSAQAAAAGRVVVVETQWAVITDTGTAFLVYVDPVQATTWTVVTSGTVTMSAAGVAVTVLAGSQSIVEPGKPPEPPTPATRATIGNRFPTVAALTNNVLQEAQVLISPAVTGAATAAATAPPTQAPTAISEPTAPPTEVPTVTPEPTVPPTAPAATEKTPT
jgi:hypothetical protein